MEAHKTHWKTYVNPEYLGAYSLEPNQELTVKITAVVRELVAGEGGKKEECTVVKLQGQKPMILNRTNAKTITKIYNTPYVEDWIGKSFTIYAAITKVKGEDVECLRIRPYAPKKILPILRVEDTEKFNSVKKALKEGYTMAQVMQKYEIPEETFNALTAVDEA